MLSRSEGLALVCVIEIGGSGGGSSLKPARTCSYRSCKSTSTDGAWVGMAVSARMGRPEMPFECAQMTPWADFF